MNGSGWFEIAFTVGLIVVNFVFWFWELSGPGVDTHVVEYGYYPCTIHGPCVDPATFRQTSWWDGTFTSMFMHGSWVHILGNMLFLWIFGNNVEDALGHVRFLLFYIAGGLVATVGQTFVTLHYAGAAAASIPNLGASGAIAAVLGAYIVLLPHASVLTFVFFFLVPIRAFLFLGIWFLLQLWEGGFSVTHPSAGGGVAFFAHVVGFIFGLLAVRLVAIRRPLEPAW